MNKRLFALVLAVCMLTLAGCGSNAETTLSTSNTPAKKLDLQALYAQMSDKLPEMLTMDETMMQTYYGIAKDDCLQAVVAICSVNVRADEVWLLEAKDNDALARLKALVDTRLAAKATELENYLPEQYAVVKKAKVITHGNYLLLLVSPDADALEEMYHTATRAR